MKAKPLAFDFYALRDKFTLFSEARQIEVPILLTWQLLQQFRAVIGPMSDSLEQQLHIELKYYRNQR